MSVIESSLDRWFWFWWRFLPVKKEFFLSTVALCTLRTGIGSEKIWCLSFSHLLHEVGFIPMMVCLPLQVRAASTRWHKSRCGDTWGRGICLCPVMVDLKANEQSSPVETDRWTGSCLVLLKQSSYSLFIGFPLALGSGMLRWCGGLWSDVCRVLRELVRDKHLHRLSFDMVRVREPHGDEAKTLLMNWWGNCC